MSEEPYNPFAAPVAVDGPAVVEEPGDWVPTADAGRRFLARFVDNMLMVVAMVVFGMVGAVAGDEAVAIVMWGGLAAYFLGQGVLIAQRGQSIGKILLKIRIVDVDSGRIPRFVFGVMLREWAFLLGGMVIPFLGLVDALFIFSSDQRCLHDYVARTRVVPVQVTYSVD
ncbi:MAG: RDD family protein [Deltaproteobacteria bacterium]|nr:RDD family protein [Deltaproteobacteria bacterium]